MGRNQVGHGIRLATVLPRLSVWSQLGLEVIHKAITVYKDHFKQLSLYSIGEVLLLKVLVSVVLFGF